MPLGLRNGLAELILDAFDRLPARRALEALARIGAGVDGAPDGEAAETLMATGWFERRASGEVQLLGAYRAHREALGRRAGAGLAAVAGRLGTDTTTPAGLLARAARLADQALYFEVHELLEPAWIRAEGLPRIALQALIQIAVALHHAGNGNRSGAISLLGEGLGKLAAAGSALPLDTDAWGAALARTLSALREGGPRPPALPWPAPTEPPCHARESTRGAGG